MSTATRVKDPSAPARPSWGNYLDPFVETLEAEARGQLQLKKLQMLLETVLRDNAFYTRKLESVGVTDARDVSSMEDYRRLPFTTKEELSADQVENPPYGTNLTFSPDRYTRIHQTSGTTGRPLQCLDTEESWEWWKGCWAAVYRAAGVTPRDRIFFAFSFGPFIGFWSGYEGARHIGSLAIPGGGMSSFQRLKAMMEHDVSVLVCTPTYALHLAEIAEEEGIDIEASNVNVTIHAGEPGASIPGTKSRIEEAWGARCYDHAGATEVGAWGYECQSQRGLHVNEGEYLAEVIDPATGEPARDGELVLTNLGRAGMPVLRYRTGDRVVRSDEDCPCGRTFMLLESGVVGRIDEAMIVRGVNIYPSAVEDLIRRFPQISEFAVDVYRRNALDEIEVQVEIDADDPETVVGDLSQQLRNGLGLRAEITAVPVGSLPRFDLKASRFTDHRDGGGAPAQREDSR